MLACILFSMFILAGCGNEKNSDRDSAKGKQETKEKTVSKENEKEENSEKDKEKNKVEKEKNIVDELYDLGGIEYTAEEALVPGREFPEVADDSVELLLGESKDFEFLKAGDEEMTAEKEETLDEKLEDIGKKELEASIVAGRILSLLGRDGSTPYQVVDDSTGKLRDVRLSDMVILFRAPSGFQQIFSEVLMSHNIPVKVQNENGYFDTMEIRLILSLLIIKNI